MNMVEDSTNRLSGILIENFKEIRERLSVLEEINKVKQEETKSKMDKLEELCRPISDYLRDNYCPYDSIVITDDKIRLVRDEIGIPVDRDSELSVEEATIGSQLVKLAVLSGDLGENPYGSKYEAELAMDNFIVGLVGNKNKKLFKSLLSEFNSKTK